jgi:hypothetical protein
LDDISKLAAFAGFRSIKSPANAPYDLLIGFDSFGETPVSIKSGLGCPPSCVNASEPSNLIFRVESPGPFPEATSICPCISSKSKPYKNCCGNIKALLTENALTFTGRSQDSKLTSLTPEEKISPLTKNLGIDGSKLIAEGMKYHFSHIGNLTFEELPKVTHKNLGWSLVRATRTSREVLLNFLAGMTPAKPFDGSAIVVSHLTVTSDGALHLYHTNDNNQNKFFEYASRAIYFDGSSRGKNKWGSIYKEGESYFLKLNLLLKQAINPKKPKKPKKKKRAKKKAKKAALLPKKVVEETQKECKKSYRAAQRHLALYLGKVKKVITRKDLREALIFCGAAGYPSFSANLVQNMTKESPLFAGNHKDGWKLTPLGEKQAKMVFKKQSKPNKETTVITPVQAAAQNDQNDTQILAEAEKALDQALGKSYTTNGSVRFSDTTMPLSDDARLRAMLFKRYVNAGWKIVDGHNQQDNESYYVFSPAEKHKSPVPGCLR